MKVKIRIVLFFDHVGYMKRFRYCNYLGKYFCNTCHSSKSTVIPARIIQRWDFKEYPFNLKVKNVYKFYNFVHAEMRKQGIANLEPCPIKFLNRLL